MSADFHYPELGIQGNGGGTVTVQLTAGSAVGGPNIFTCLEPVCSALGTVGTVYTLTAAPVPGSSFAGWSGACSGTGTCTVTLGQVWTIVTATFTPLPSGGSQRYVALGDSVPYGHGLANPYPTAQIGLPGSATSQGPAADAYPGLVAHDLGLTMLVRSTDCTLTGDDLAVSGAKLAASNTVRGNDQCPSVYTRSESVQSDELPAANLSNGPAQLVTIQAGADDINFGKCLLWEITKIGLHARLGTQCVKNGAVTSAVSAELVNVHDELVTMLKQISPYANRIAVLNYYQVIPNPRDFAQSSIFPSGQVDEVCWFLSHNLRSARNDAVIVQNALNVVIASAIRDAQRAGVGNVTRINIANLEAAHEMCTSSPAVFSGNPMPKREFDVDFADAITGKKAAIADMMNHAWRTAHPNSFGQRDIASAVEGAIAP